MQLDCTELIWILELIELSNEFFRRKQQRVEIGRVLVDIHFLSFKFGLISLMSYCLLDLTEFAIPGHSFVLEPVEQLILIPLSLAKSEIRLVALPLTYSHHLPYILNE